MQIEMKEQKCLIASSSVRLEPLEPFFEKRSYSSVMVLADEHVFSFHGEALMARLDALGVPLVPPWIIPSGEQYKNLATLESCWAHMHHCGLDRKSLIVAMGGGVATDLAGVAAACYMRGIDSLLIPTTLMGMVDAAIGGKAAANLPSGKNLIGAFHHPRLILIAPHYLQTLPMREFKSGLAEVIKYGIIRDVKLFEYLERQMPALMDKNPPQLKHIIQTSCAIKAEIVQEDPQEKGLRAILNFGHTFGHAIETMTNYTIYLHGEAISIGMCCASYLSKQLGFVDQRFVDRVFDLCRQAGLPTRLPENFDVEKCIELMRADKKAVGGKIHVIIARKIGFAELLKDIDAADIKQGLEEMKRIKS